MKSSDIASLHASQSADWQRRGTGGLVKAVAGGTLTVSNGARTLTVSTTPTTVYRRYAGDSVQFEDAKPGSLAEIAPGDQLRVRGAKSPDGTSIAAEEIVSGAFENLAGAVSKVDAAAGTVTLKDLRHQASRDGARDGKLQPQGIYPRRLPLPSHAITHAPGAAPASDASATKPAAESTDAPSSRRAGSDLSQLLGRLPLQPLAEIKPGDAVLIVASRTGGTVTAVTMLSGVEQILSASPGASAPTLSPWNLGGGEAESASGSGGI